MKEIDKFSKITTFIEGLYLIEIINFKDQRGNFTEVYNKKEFKNIGLKLDFVQDNHIKSKKGVLRGLHLQTEHPQGKLARVIKGIFYDVIVDLREDSKSYGEYYGIILSEEEGKMLYIPEGCAHGLIALSDEAEFMYKTTDYYYPEYATGIIWNDRDLAIDWPLEEYGIKEGEIILSDKDKNLPTLKEYKAND
nr:dTDP-4-dehydrorhamnose 3,5-epimerase [Orenia marismortui]